MEPDLKRIPYGIVLEKILSSVELIGGTNRQTRVQPDVFLMLGKAVIGDPKLERFWNWWVKLFNRFKGN